MKGFKKALIGSLVGMTVIGTAAIAIVSSPGGSKKVEAPIAADSSSEAESVNGRVVAKGFDFENTDKAKVTQLGDIVRAKYCHLIGRKEQCRTQIIMTSTGERSETVTENEKTFNFDSKDQVRIQGKTLYLDTLNPAGN